MAVGLMPVVAVSWSLLPLIWLLGYHLVTGHETLAGPGTQIAFGVAVLLEMICTFLIYPYRSSMPVVLRWAMPPITVGVALGLTALYLRKREEQPLFGAFFMFALIHGLLQVIFFILLRR